MPRRVATTPPHRSSKSRAARYARVKTWHRQARAMRAAAWWVFFRSRFPVGFSGCVERRESRRRACVESGRLSVSFSVTAHASFGRFRSSRAFSRETVSRRRRVPPHTVLPHFIVRRVTSASATRALASVTVRAMLLFLGRVFGSPEGKCCDGDAHLLPTRVSAKLRLNDEGCAPLFEVCAPIACAPPRRLNLGRNEVVERRGHQRASDMNGRKSCS